MVGSVARPAVPRHGHRALRLELAGPAGVGKSTVSRALVESCGGEAASIWGQPVSPLLGHGMFLLPTLWKFWRQSRSLLWDESRHIVRLATLHRTLSEEKRPNHAILIFDEGPVFALAWLRGFGHPVLRHPASAQWWRTTLRSWAGAIDVLVLLDAPDPMLATRIRTRPDAHEIKQASDAEIAAWMARFRTALKWVLEGMAAEGGPQILQVRTDRHSPGQIAGRVRLELGRISYVP